MTKPIDKPSWLTALNGKKEQPLAPTDEVLQEPAVLEVGEDESVAALPKYDTPPPLDLTPPKQAIGRWTRILEDKPPAVIKDITESVPNTMLPFPFDAEAFGRHVYIPEFVGNDGVTTFPEQDRMPDVILDNGSFIEFKTASPSLVTEGTLQKGQGIILDIISKKRSCETEDHGFNKVTNFGGIAEQVTKTGQQALEDVISRMPKEIFKEFKESLNEFEGLETTCKTCKGTGIIKRSIRHSESDYEEWDDNCSDCIGTGASPTATMPALFNVPKDLEPGIYTGTIYNGEFLPDAVNVMPFMPNEEALLPEPKVGLEGREVLSSESWLGLMTPTESIAYDNHINLVMQSNPLHAAKLIRLKGFKSKYFQEIITTPEKAEEHIRVALVKGEDPGGWDNSDHRRIKQAQELIAKGFEVKAKAEARQRHRQYIQQTRDIWKKAVEDRKSAMELLDIDVSNKKEAFRLAREMTFNEYMARFEP